jgi:hypothetical protein
MISREYFRWLGMVRAGVIALLTLAAMGAASAADMKLEAKLIWATNDQNSPDPKHKPASPELAQWLEKHYAWKHYFLVERTNSVIAEGVTGKFVMSDKCTVEVKNLGKNVVGANLIGEGKSYSKITLGLPPGESLGLAGDSRNDTAWFVVLKNTGDAAPAAAAPPTAPAAPPAPATNAPK